MQTQLIASPHGSLEMCCLCCQPIDPEDLEMIDGATYHRACGDELEAQVLDQADEMAAFYTQETETERETLGAWVAGFLVPEGRFSLDQAFEIFNAGERVAQDVLFTGWAWNQETVIRCLPMDVLEAMRDKIIQLIRHQDGVNAPGS